MKVEVEFPTEYTSDKPGVIPVGRLYLGDGHIVRIVFCPDGKTRIAIDKSAIKAGMVIVSAYSEENIGLAGFLGDSHVG